MGPSTIEDAAAAVVDMEAAVAKWTGDAEARRIELDELAGDEATIGTDVPADDAAAEDAVRRLLEVRARTDVANRARTAALQRMEEARRDLLRARAAVVRDRASRLREVAAERQRETDRLLDLLEEHEGPRYIVPEPMLGLTLAVGPTSWKVPLTTIILRGANALEAWAAEVEQWAGTGTGEQLVHHLRRPMPDVLPVERQFATVDEPDAGTDSGDAAESAESQVLAAA